MMSGMTNETAHDVFLVPETFPTIQKAVDAAVRPTTIVVAPGLYSGTVRVTAKEYVVIQSSRLTRRGVTLSGGEGGSVLLIENSTLHLSGIEIRSRGASRGLLVVGSSISLQDCVVAGNRVSDVSEPFGAGLLGRNSSIHLQKSVISANSVACDSSDLAGGGGIYLLDCTAQLAGCTVQINEVWARGEAHGGGIWCERTKLRMWRSRVTDNAIRGSRCTGAGIYFKQPNDTQLGGSVITGNGSVDGAGGGIFIADGSAAASIHRNSFVRQNHPDDVAFGVAPAEGRE